MQHSASWIICLVLQPVAAAALVLIQAQALALVALLHLECLVDQIPSQVHHQVQCLEGFSNQSSHNSSNFPIHFKALVEVQLALDSSMVLREAWVLLVVWQQLLVQAQYLEANRSVQDLVISLPVQHLVAANPLVEGLATFRQHSHSHHSVVANPLAEGLATFHQHSRSHHSVEISSLVGEAWEGCNQWVGKIWVWYQRRLRRI